MQAKVPRIRMPFTHRLSFAFLTVLLTATFLVWWLCLASRVHFVEEASIRAQNVALFVSKDLELALSKIHADIRNIEHFVESEDLTVPLTDAARANIDAILSWQRESDPQVFSIGIFSANGDNIFATDRIQTPINVRDRPWFVALRDEDQRTLVMSDILSDRALEVPKLLTLAVPIRRADGVFSGILVASINLGYFQKLLQGQNLGTKGMVSIRQSDTNKLLLRWPTEAPMINQLTPNPLAQRIMAGEVSGVIEATSPVDLVPRMMAFERAGHYPVVCIVGLAREDFLYPWMVQTWVVAAITIAVELLLSVLFLRMQRELRERKKTEVKLVRSEERLNMVIDSSREGILVVQNDLIVFVNPAIVEMIGSGSQHDILGTPILSWVHPDFHSFVIEQKNLMIKEGKVRSLSLIEIKLVGADRREIVVEIYGTQIIYMGESAIQASVRDVTERKMAESKIHLAASVFQNASEGIIISEKDGAIIEVNDAFLHITGYSRDEVIGLNMLALNSSHQPPEFDVSMWRSLETLGCWRGELWSRRKCGELYASLVHVSSVDGSPADSRKYVALFSDITSIKEHQSQLEHLAHYDALTQLPNRRLLADRLHQAMAQAHCRSQQLALVYLDLDGFKHINDQYGHAVGDQLLIHLATAMKSTLREGDTLARLGGDEFVAVLIDLNGPDSSISMLRRLLQVAASQVQLDKALGGLTLQCSASLGVTFYPQTQELEADQLLRQADQAMYQAKLTGKNRYHFFDAGHDSDLRKRNESLERIRLALARHEFVLFYQPKVNMRSGQVLGAEALIRWQHPERGLLAPAAFLPVIENHELSIDVGEWVIGEALRQIEQWSAGWLNLTVSVNVGAYQLQRPDFMERLHSILAQHPQAAANSLELEVLETSALEDIEQVSDVIEACRQIGVRFALDDFGTGYSSLIYLKHLRVATLKIDQSFVRNMLDDPDDLAILEGVIGLAAAFRREVIAEGVETVDHGTALLHLGCEIAQGYGIARPMPSEQLPRWVATWRPNDAWMRNHLNSWSASG